MRHISKIKPLKNLSDQISCEIFLLKTFLFVGGVIQMRQGKLWRFCVKVEPVTNSGTLTINCNTIVSISVGTHSDRNKLQKPLDGQLPGGRPPVAEGQVD